MKILDVISVYYYQFEIETEFEGILFYRRGVTTCFWERLYGESWETEHNYDELEKLYQEWIRRT